MLFKAVFTEIWDPLYGSDFEGPQWGPIYHELHAKVYKP